MRSPGGASRSAGETTCAPICMSRTSTTMTDPRGVRHRVGSGDSCLRPRSLRPAALPTRPVEECAAPQPEGQQRPQLQIERPAARDDQVEIIRAEAAGAENFHKPKWQQSAQLRRTQRKWREPTRSPPSRSARMDRRRFARRCRHHADSHSQVRNGRSAALTASSAGRSQPRRANRASSSMSSTPSIGPCPLDDNHDRVNTVLIHHSRRRWPSSQAGAAPARSSRRAAGRMSALPRAYSKAVWMCSRSSAVSAASIMKVRWPAVM